MDERNITLMNEILEQLDKAPMIPKELDSNPIAMEYAEFFIQVSIYIKQNHMNAKAEFKKYIAAAMKDLFTARGNYLSIVSDTMLRKKLSDLIDTCVQSDFEKTANVERNCIYS
jgi:hypothetical protein